MIPSDADTISEAEIDGLCPPLQWAAFCRSVGNAVGETAHRDLLRNVPDEHLDRVVDRQSQDPAWTWRRIRSSVRVYVAAATRARRFDSASLRRDLREVLWPAPVIELDGRFVLNTKKPRRRDWRWIIALRENAELPEDGIGNHWHHLAACLPSVPSRESLAGQDIVDLIACDADLKTVTSRFLGLTAVAGFPLQAHDAWEPVRIYETPLAWLLARGAGVFLCGDDAEVGDWLRNCTAGLVAPSVPFATALRRKMRRTELPQILGDA